jgi:2-aminoadipate transaminase
MRLNFSGVPEAAIREGVRRIGEVVQEQVAMYGTLTGASPAVAERPARQDPAPAGGTADGELAPVLPLAQRKRTA